MVMGRFLINIYTISPFTSIREEQGLNMEGCTLSITQEKLGVGQTHFIGQ
jgi:hypothetical protein